jgi:D-alanyl-lipoteichoic acid acyltransferase DltB (MBOAT superfamily)
MLLSRLLTFHFVCIGWVFFRAPSIDSVAELFRALVRWEGLPSISAAIVLAIAIGLFGQFFPAIRRTALRERFSRLPLMLQGLTFAVAILLIEALGPQGVAPFIYFQF